MQKDFRFQRKFVFLIRFGQKGLVHPFGRLQQPWLPFRRGELLGVLRLLCQTLPRVTELSSYRCVKYLNLTIYLVYHEFDLSHLFCCVWQQQTWLESMDFWVEDVSGIPSVAPVPWVGEWCSSNIACWTPAYSAKIFPLEFSGSLVTLNLNDFISDLGR